MAKRKKSPPAETRPLSDGEALYRAVLASPDDDTPRLVYADWLEENDQPDRAEFIHVQIALEREQPTGKRYVELKRKEAELWEAHKEEWTHSLPLSLRKSTYLSSFCRGFFAKAKSECEEFIDPKQGLSLWQHGPLQSIEFSLIPSDEAGERLAACPWLERVSELEVGSIMSLQTAQTLAQSAGLRNIRKLDLSNLNSDLEPNERQEIMENLLASSYLQQITHLNLSECHTELLPFGDPAHLPETLTSLDISANPYDPAEVKNLLASPTCHLTSLNLSSTYEESKMSGRQAQAIAQTAGFQRLTHLELDSTAQTALFEEVLKGKHSITSLSLKELSARNLRRLSHSGLSFKKIEFSIDDENLTGSIQNAYLFDLYRVAERSKEAVFIIKTIALTEKDLQTPFLVALLKQSYTQKSPYPLNTSRTDIEAVLTGAELATLIEQSIGKPPAHLPPPPPPGDGNHR